MSHRTLAALLTCFNRRQSTLDCLQSLAAQQGDGSLDISIVLVDDGSSDGTAEAVREAFPQATILTGQGNLYWGGGMRRAFGHALELGFDFYLWLNDDIVLDPDALQHLVGTHDSLQAQGQGPAMVCGAMGDPHQPERLTYSGVVRKSGLEPVAFKLLPPEPDRAVRCHASNGNCVLIPAEVAARTGNIDAAYQHYLGDFDYGLRASEKGCSVWIAPGLVGQCEESVVVRRQGPAPGFGEALNALRQPKGLNLGGIDLLPLREWRVFCRNHAGVLWPLFWLAPYRRLLPLLLTR